MHFLTPLIVKDPELERKGSGDIVEIRIDYPKIFDTGKYEILSIKGYEAKESLPLGLRPPLYARRDQCSNTQPN